METFPRYWPFVRGIHRSPVNSPHKGQWRRSMMFSLICAWMNDWVNNREAGDLRRHRAHYDVIVMWYVFSKKYNATLLLVELWLGRVMRLRNMAIPCTLYQVWIFEKNTIGEENLISKNLGGCIWTYTNAGKMIYNSTKLRGYMSLNL